MNQKNQSPQNKVEPAIIPPAVGAANAGAGAEGGQNMDKVRELIFGGQMRDYEERFTAIEARFVKDGLHLRHDMEERMDALEGLVKREFEALNDKIKIESKERTERLSSMESLLTKADRGLSERLNNAESKTLEETRSLRNQEHEDIKKVRQNLQELRNELTTQFEEEIETLRKTKVDRASVAALFAGGTL